MYTLDINISKKSLRKTALLYLILTVFFAALGLVYEYFSHGVYSGFMIFAFLFPLIGIVIPAFLLLKFPAAETTGTESIAPNIYKTGILTLTIGSIIKGILDIYGTTNNLIFVYLVAGIALIITGLIIMLKKQT